MVHITSTSSNISYGRRENDGVFTFFELLFSNASLTASAQELAVDSDEAYKFYRLDVLTISP